MIRPFPKRPKPPTWRNQMTVCIAALCEQSQDNREQRIVVCYDWNSEHEMAGSETADKLRVLPRGWIALMADTLSRCEELVARYETHLREMKGLVDDNHLFEEMKKPAHAQKAALANDYMMQTLGVSYADLVSPDKNFPEEIVSKRLEEVAQIKLRAALIVAGFVATQQADIPQRETNPYVFVVDDQNHEDVVRVEENWGVVGTGSYVAIPALHQREQDNDTDLMETIYNLYEAKRLAEVVPGVGESTSIAVMYPDGTLKSWTEPLLNRCKWIFDRIGPKFDIPEKKAKEYFAFKDEFLEPYDIEEKPEGNVL